MIDYPVFGDFSEKMYYPDPSVPIHTWTAYASDFPPLSYVNHWHSDFEFAYVTKGSMKENINGRIVDINEGDLLFVNSGSMHYGFWTEPVYCEFICLAMHPSIIGSAAAAK